MVNSCNSRSPILLDTPERPPAGGASAVIEIPDSGDSHRSSIRRRRLDSFDDVIVADNSKRARVDERVPVIDLTADNDDDPSTAEINTERLLISMHNSQRTCAELRARLLPDDARIRIRRTSLRHRSTSLYARHLSEERSGSHGNFITRGDGVRNNQINAGAADSNRSFILVEDDDRSSHFDGTEQSSGYTLPSCNGGNPPRVPISSANWFRPLIPSSVRNERSRSQTHGNLFGQEPTDNETERLYRNNRCETSQQFRSARRNQRRQRQPRERNGHLSPLSNYVYNSDAGFEIHFPTDEFQLNRPPTEDPMPSSFNETASQRLPRRTPSTLPLERTMQPYLQDLLFPAMITLWSPDSRRLGDVDEEREDYEALWSLSERLGQVKPKGLCKADMEAIPAFRYSAASKDSSNGICVVCLTNYSNKEKLRRLPCNHDFHAKCIDRWLKNNRSCPVCRKDVSAKQ